jgi:hypothetical protein
VFLNLQALGARTICLPARPALQYAMPEPTRQKITLGKMRASGVAVP